MLCILYRQSGTEHSVNSANLPLREARRHPPGGGTPGWLLPFIPPSPRHPATMAMATATATTARHSKKEEEKNYGYLA
jgi:hypothetical protein